MTQAIRIALRAMVAMVAMIFTSVVIFQTASAQEPPPPPPPTNFDIKVASGINGLPDGHLDLGVQFDNGFTMNYIATSEGVSPVMPVPAGANVITAVRILGIWRPISSQNLICIQRFPSGCWCLCLQWVNFWGINWPRLFVYFNPCC